MSLSELLAGIRFRFLQPQRPLPIRLWTFLWHHPRVRGVVERCNTMLPVSPSTRRALATLAGMPRMSTLAIAAVIDEAVRRMPVGQLYVNVGVWHGFSLFAGMVGNPDTSCIGVDDFSQFGSPRAAFLRRSEKYRSQNHSFIEADYERYFREQHRGPIGVYFYDGHHTYDHQKRGLEIAESFFAPGCIVIVDDTNWGEPRRATLDFLSERPGQYDVLADVSTAGNCHPMWWNGFMVLRRRSFCAQ